MEPTKHMSNPKKSTIREKVAVIVSAAIVLSGIVYWSLQIYYANEMLKLAHGG